MFLFISSWLHTSQFIRLWERQDYAMYLRICYQWQYEQKVQITKPQDPSMFRIVLLPELSCCTGRGLVGIEEEMRGVMVSPPI